MKISIIIPVYNEKDTIKEIICRVEESFINDIRKEIIIIDDGSDDGTRDILLQISDKYKILLKDKNEGKGSAIKEGFKRAAGDLLIIQDADLEYDPKDYKELIAPILDGKADVVYGSRFISNKPHRVLYFWHYLGNKALTTLSNIFTNLNLSDMETGYKAFNRKAIDAVKNKIKSKSFGIEPELTALIAKNNLRIYEVGVSYSGRTYEEGKKVNWKDGVAAIWHIIKYNIFS